MTKVLQFLERLWWVFVLAFASALSAPEVAEVITGLLSDPVVIDISGATAAWVAGTMAVFREVVAFGQARIKVLPNPGGVPTPIVSGIERRRGSA